MNTEANSTKTSADTFQIVSNQTGNFYGRVQATSEDNAIDQYAQARGYADRFAMWKDGRGEYLAAYEVRA
jgi:hypothetical protein